MPTMLTPADFLKLETESGIDRLTVERVGLRRVDWHEGAALVGRDAREDCAGIAFPVFFPGHPNVREWFLRLDRPLMQAGKPVRYLAPPGRGNKLMSGPGEPMEALSDVCVGVAIFEGLKKLLCGYRLARYQIATPRFLAFGIAGVYGYRGVTGKTTDANGARVDVKGVVPDFDRITWIDRDVVVIFDSDVSTNPDVAAARRGLVAELQKRGARVAVVDLPALDGLPKVGFDDFVARRGPRLALALLQRRSRPYQQHRKGPAV